MKDDKPNPMKNKYALLKEAEDKHVETLDDNEEDEDDSQKPSQYAQFLKYVFHPPFFVHPSCLLLSICIAENFQLLANMAQKP